MCFVSTTRTAEQIIGINALHLGGQPAVRDAGHVASAAMRPQTVMLGEGMFPTLTEKAAALLHSLICTHSSAADRQRAR